MSDRMEQRKNDDYPLHTYEGKWFFYDELWEECIGGFNSKREAVRELAHNGEYHARQELAKCRKECGDE